MYTGTCPDNTYSKKAFQKDVQRNGALRKRLKFNSRNVHFGGFCRHPVTSRYQSAGCSPAGCISSGLRPNF
ncbi:MAG: hypothetical protein CMN32_03455 [Saprospirales bacterium]|nr:hypothetical protein [Saprospirales bacterium]